MLHSINITFIYYLKQYPHELISWTTNRDKTRSMERKETWSHLHRPVNLAWTSEHLMYILETKGKWVKNQSTRKNVMYDGCKTFEAWRILKQAHRKQKLTSVQDTSKPEYFCNIWSRVYWSSTRLASNMRSHNNKQLLALFILVLLQQPIGSLCLFPD